MVSRCRFITSSYWSRCLRVSKLRASTDFCAASMRFETIFDSMATPFSIPRRCMSALTLSPAKMRIRSSSSERKKREEPGSPWRPARPRNWLSMRRDSWRSVPRMCRPPKETTSLCSFSTKGLM